MNKKIRIFDVKTDSGIIRYQPLLEKKLIKISVSQNDFKFSDLKIPSSNSAMELLINHFINLIKKKEENYYDLELALKVTSVIESISNLLDQN